MPGGALVATHPFSPVPVAVPVAVLVCHVCQPLPAPYSFSGLLLPEPLCPLSDGTRCPWCYYPRTLLGRARGRFPPIIVISNGQPGEREWEKERGGGWTEPLSPVFFSPLSAPALDKEPLKSAGCILGCFMCSETKKTGTSGRFQICTNEREKKSHKHTDKTKKNFAEAFTFRLLIWKSKKKGGIDRRN